MATDRVSKGISLPRELYDELEAARPVTAHRSMYYVYWLSLGYLLDQAVSDIWDDDPFDVTDPLSHENKAAVQTIARVSWAHERQRIVEEIREELSEDG